MTSKIYKTARGKSIDLGALMLENEHIRAVGNMNVNARGDLLDSTNTVIDPKRKQVQRQYARQSNVQATPVTSGTREARSKKQEIQQEIEDEFEPRSLEIDPVQLPEEKTNPTDSTTESSPKQSVPRGGLAAAIARSREVKQELMKTQRQLAQEKPGVKKI